MYNELEMISNESQKIPKEYQEVEYIESTGEQYIDTGVYCTEDMSMEMTVTFLNETAGAMFGAIQKEGYGYLRYHTGLFENAFESCIGFANSNYYYSTRILTDNSIHIYKMSTNLISIDEVQKNIIGDVGVPSNMTFWLFYRNHDNAQVYKQHYCKARLYASKFYIKDTLVRDFIPCYRKSDSMVGLYDTVENKFYENKGTDAFIKGETF